jgi:hypothetical protein
MIAIKTAKVVRYFQLLIITIKNIRSSKNPGKLFVGVPMVKIL